MWIIPLSHLLEKAFTHGQLQNVSLGEVHKPNIAGELCYCLLLVLYIFVSGGLFTYYHSSPVHFGPVISYTSL